jgi:hypothetical protein
MIDDECAVMSHRCFGRAEEARPLPAEKRAIVIGCRSETA